jgi:hypothetical protein
MLTDLKAVFYSLKSELGLWFIYHQIEDRVERHACLFRRCPKIRELMVKIKM